jgi:phytoene synthase
VAVANWRTELEAVYTGAPRTTIGRALTGAVQQFRIPQEPLLEVIRGVQMDLAGNRYQTFDELTVYMRRVASAVGLACLPILGAGSAESRVYADRLGLALQFTNILRDLAADAGQGRLYLPTAELRQFAVQEEWLRSGVPAQDRAASAAVVELLRFQDARAKALFREADASLPAGEQRALLPARVMRNIYRRLLEELEAAGSARLRQSPIRLGRARKLWIAARTWYRQDDFPR